MGWQKIETWLDSHTMWLSVAAAAVWICVVLVWWPSLSSWADLHPGVAAWVQAIGVFAAVVLAGELARRQVAQQERSLREERVNSARAVIGKAVQALNDIKYFLYEESENAKVANPIIQITNVLDAITAKRIHELPEFVMVDTALDVRTGLADILRWTNGNLPLLGEIPQKPWKMPEGLESRVRRTLADCADFERYSSKWLSMN